jgi:hypothetical protein
MRLVFIFDFTVHNLFQFFIIAAAAGWEPLLYNINVANTGRGHHTLQALPKTI